MDYSLNRLIFVILMLPAFCFANAIELEGTHALPSTSLKGETIGILRLFCLEEKKFLSFSGTRDFSSIIPLREKSGENTSCQWSDLHVIEEMQIPPQTLSKEQSGLIRKISIDSFKVLLFSAKNGGGSLLQYW